MSKLKEIIKERTIEKMELGLTFEPAIHDVIEEIKHKFSSLKEMNRQNIEFLKDDIYKMIYE